MISVLSTLTPECRQAVAKVILACSAQGLQMHPYGGARSPLDQARLWRQSRSGATVAAEIIRLQHLGCTFLASCLVQAGPCDGKWATNAIPGLSWHNYAQACDLVVVMKNGVFNWGDKEAYAKFGKIAEQEGMLWGGRFNDMDHVQLFKDEPLEHYGCIEDINAVMEAKWGSVR